MRTLQPGPESGYTPSVFIMPVIVGGSNVFNLFLHAGHLYETNK